jgi:hypothetical protein
MHEVVVDLASRWRRARLAALSAALPGAADQPSPLDEAARLAGADDDAAEEALRKVFDNSHELGRSFRRFHRVDLPLGDLAALLPHLGSPCVSGDWRRESDEGVYRTDRVGCDMSPRHRRTCDYWREAIGGLVLGLTCGIYHARHHSLGHGAERCTDVLYVHPQSPERYGPIPEEVRSGLESLRRTTRIFDSTFELDFLGISEGVLYYTASRDGVAGDFNLVAHVERGVARRFPWLTPREASPRSVFSEQAL